MSARASTPGAKNRSGVEGIGEAVEARLLAGDPADGAQGAMGERAATLGAMAELQALAGSGEEHRVLPFDFAGRDHRETDAAGLAEALPAGTPIYRGRTPCLAHELR